MGAEADNFVQDFVGHLNLLQARQPTFQPAAAHDGNGIVVGIKTTPVLADVVGHYKIELLGFELNPSG